MNHPLSFHVYLIRSLSDPSKYYKGFTTDPVERLAKHNRGEVKSTTANCPWVLQTLISFETRDKALAFERYSKSHSGRAFSAKHF